MGILQQFEKLDKDGAHICLPVQGAVLAARVRVTIAAGLVDLKKLLRQATVRRNVVEQLIRMRTDAGHPDYQRFDLADVSRRVRELATSDEPDIPSDIVEFLNAEDAVTEEFFSGVDKAATPAERAYTAGDLRRNLERTRPQSVVVQRDSDANRDVLASRDSALSHFSSLALQPARTSSTSSSRSTFPASSARRCRAWPETQAFRDTKAPGEDSKILSRFLSACTPP